MINDVYITEACRTAVGNMGGALKNVQPVELATCVVKGV